MTDMSDHLDMTVRSISDRVAVVAVTGDVDLHTAPALRTYALTLVEQGAAHLVLDLAGVDFVDSTGLSTFLVLLRVAQDAGGSLHLADVPDRLMRMVTMTGISELLPVHATVADALTSSTTAGAADGADIPG
ncbi:STAS domain-containing protein [Streptomyces sp. NPDC100445]|uniref:STAS domain-containing protein n=1 Tax=Streptomyces sp. NPDC100445 TaxID=3366102 RepID=UPI003829CD0A